MVRTYYVYILANDSRDLYVGATKDVRKRAAQHRTGLNPKSYTTTHQVFRLVYCESTADLRSAIRREKQIKGWTRSRKIELIEQANPTWRDLAENV